MTTHSDQMIDKERAAMLDRAGEVGDRHGSPVERDQLARLLTRYFRHTPVEEMRLWDAVDLAGAALSHRQLAESRPPGTAKVRTFTPTVERNAWSTGHSVLEIVTDDMPFLVDSVIAELNRQECGIHLIVHPQVVVRRDDAGGLQEVLDTDVADWPDGDDGAVVESWMHLEIDRQNDPARLEELTQAVTEVLDDVRVAVEDWPAMLERVTGIIDRLATDPPPGIAEEEVEEARELLTWLTRDHFTFLGFRQYQLAERDGQDSLAPVPGTGLGILRHDQTASSSFERLNSAGRARAREKTLLVMTKAGSRATVHRNVYLDYVGIKSFDAAGEVIGECRFLGLLASSAYTDSVRRIPVISRKVAQVLDRAGFHEDSHSGKDLAQILETYPRDELFEIDVDELARVAESVMNMQQRRRARLFLRQDPYGRFVSCLIYLPRDRYNTAVRLKVTRLLEEAFNALSIDYTARVSESALARLHVVVRLDPANPPAPVDPVDLEQRLVQAARSWEEDLNDALLTEVGEGRAADLLRAWSGGFPEGYKEDFPARVAVSDLQRLEELAAAVAGDGEVEDGADLALGDGTPEQAIGMNLYSPVGAAADEGRLKLYRLAPLSLTAVLPFLANLGVEVIDERPYLLERGQGPAWIYDFGLRYSGDVADGELSREAFCQAFAAAWSGQAESDGFDRLVLLAGLSWRQVVILRAYAKYLRQSGTTFSQDYIERCLRANVPIVRNLVALFEARFDPDTHPDSDDGRRARGAACAELVEQVTDQLDGVASLDQDRILRAVLGLIQATLRTNAFQEGEDGARRRPYVALKLDPTAIPDLPAPRPAFEIFVYAPWVEGVHLRFGPVARGGLRWSDRLEDFRTEVLGLVKAQMVKNAVIVPTGAKGGFVGKMLPDPSVDREAWLQAGIDCYTTFISGLLDVTDNLEITVPPDGSSSRVVVPPQRVVRHDGDDTYLVVAADKGTASFSDIANSVAQRYGFWLGDAFASGGSVGYDHKAMGITAKGAWESVRLHFRELGLDTQREEFTVVGIGDMSGDVFGNGMLLSEHIRLVAAFDHRHIFLDPDPDTAAAYAERRRMFELPRSSWADYDTSLLSEGGGVHPRTAKSITITRQVAERLGLAEDVGAMTPADLINAILRAPADLLWNGGIGTYVKASTQSHADVGDKANDTIRIDGHQLRCRVVGEGGNLGFTQLGRIEAAMAGVRINTDAIDNSAGVDCSDHEVNIKILLDRVVAAGDLTAKQRNELLAEMTDDVAELVLQDNYEQNVLLGNARKQSHAMLSVHQRFMRELEQQGLLDRELEFLPDDATMAARDHERTGLTSPEFSVLVAYSKIALSRDVLGSELPDEPWFGRILTDYFPAELSSRFGDLLSEHPLRRELITTCLVNEMVNRGGITFAFRAVEETGAATPQVVRAYTVCREVFGLRDFVRQVESLDNKVPTEAQTALYLAFRRLLDRAVRWFLQTRADVIEVGPEIDRFHPVVAELGPRMPELLVGAERARLHAEVSRLERLGVPEDLARRGASLLIEFQLLDITEISAQVDSEPAEVAPVYTMLSERYDVDSMLTLISHLDRSDRWCALARAALRYDLYAALESLTVAVLTASPNHPMEPLERIETWEQANRAAVERAVHTLAEVRDLERSDIASLSVALRTLRSVVRSAG